ncbi:DedA family protein/thiosulfate sulfurtransferase GlpE [Methylovorus menthalis]|uniref:DedA family protein/thiosulfate sulfurtransferase GlpE n=1 Tax=Methylovorus menthalis TaxID=1002227 RepID=UPI001E284151|nr:DedA family protein/thiosulfate sulfurtransferase GlpE [Methylovorus menthalis]MCB4810018.1 DedA family protein/thiosulfate sulfurtransferase GlpE [Methylovorus menthalis]
MQHLLDLLQQYGLLIVFANVFLEQIGLPIPAYPTLLVTGALLTQGQYSPAQLLLTAVIASLLADLAWYFAGRRFGRRVMSKLCRISLSPDSCVRQTESVYLRIGPPALLFCKFIPGFASVSSALAGTVGTRVTTFIIFDSLGAAIWAGSAIVLGTLFSSAIDELLDILSEMGKWGALLLGIALVAFILNKWWERHRFIKSLRMARISVDELDTMLKSGSRPVIVDARPAHLQGDGRIPGALSMTEDTIDTVFIDTDIDTDIVLYCSCPNDVTAAKMAKLLIKRGYHKVRPLKGGIDAWVDAGFKIEP